MQVDDYRLQLHPLDNYVYIILKSEVENLSILEGVTCMVKLKAMAGVSTDSILVW